MSTPVCAGHSASAVTAARSSRAGTAVIWPRRAPGELVQECGARRLCADRRCTDAVTGERRARSCRSSSPPASSALSCDAPRLTRAERALRTRPSLRACAGHWGALNRLPRRMASQSGPTLVFGQSEFGDARPVCANGNPRHEPRSMRAARPPMRTISPGRVHFIARLSANAPRELVVLPRYPRGRSASVEDRGFGPRAERTDCRRGIRANASRTRLRWHTGYRVSLGFAENGARCVDLVGAHRRQTASGVGRRNIGYRPLRRNATLAVDE
jgi:hypothetical protein